MVPGSIRTVTLNPALDITTATEQVLPEHKLRCDPPADSPGGGGINVARVVHILGGAATAVYPAGGARGLALQTLLEGQGLPQRVVPIAGRTRESVTVNDRSAREQYRFVMPGPRLSAAELQRCLQAAAEQQPPPAYLVASGSLPPGVPADFYAELAALARRQGSRFVLDTSGEALRQAGREPAYLLKPNLRELSELVGAEPVGETEQLAAARQLISEGRTEVVVLSLGADGALLATAETAVRLPALKVPVRSTVGAGDSMLGALVLALTRGADFADALRYGIAAGAAALMTPGTGICRCTDVERLYAAARR